MSASDGLSWKTYMYGVSHKQEKWMYIKRQKLSKKLLNKNMIQLGDCKHGESYATVPHFTIVSNPLTLRLLLVMTRFLASFSNCGQNPLVLPLN